MFAACGLWLPGKNLNSYKFVFFVLFAGNSDLITFYNFGILISDIFHGINYIPFFALKIFKFEFA
ncbi:MAG: CRISPR-associated DxTHG motif protein [Candidatus Moranbacteria bacterium]|nr:CRISPR-associated DxTHG motif protein [Candidatus Moranbacteria bacterium]